MYILGNSEYGLLLVTIIVGAMTRGLIDIFVYGYLPYQKDIFTEIWMGRFIYDKYWVVVFGILIPMGYVLGKLITGHFKTILYRGETHKGSICRRICGC